jgi:hypothetical protein
MPGHYLLLPAGELDPAPVLRSGAVLGEQAGPVLPVGEDRGVADGLSTVHRTARMDGVDGGGCFVDEAPVLVVAGDPQRVHPLLGGGQATVAEVEAEEVGVIAAGQVDVGQPAPRHLLARTRGSGRSRHSRSADRLTPSRLLIELRLSPAAMAFRAVARTPSSYMRRDSQRAPTDGRICALGGTRTHTERVLNPRSLPIGVPGQRAES